MGRLTSASVHHDRVQLVTIRGNHVSFCQWKKLTFESALGFRDIGEIRIGGLRTGINVVGIFPNEAASIRLSGDILLEQNGPYSAAT
jgi:hypothetical protein